MTKTDLFKKFMGSPVNYDFEHRFEFIKKYECEDFDCELYIQANGVRPDGTVTHQRVFIALPKNIKGKLPAVVVPFYYPEAAMGFDPEKMEVIEKYKDNPTMLDIVKEGYIAISAESYYLTYSDYDGDNEGLERWGYVAKIFNKEQPEWSGIGKLIYDTGLLIDVIEKDPRVDSNKIGIAGHSLGGKIAFILGCIDQRIKVILASDFGLLWHQTNWQDDWYWGEKIALVKNSGLENYMLLQETIKKPFCLIAGLYDTEESLKVLYGLEEYKDCPERIFAINHRSGHRPPNYAAKAGYLFLDKWLKRRYYYEYTKK